VFEIVNDKGITNKVKWSIEKLTGGRKAGAYTRLLFSST